VSVLRLKPATNDEITFTKLHNLQCDVHLSILCRKHICAVYNENIIKTFLIQQ
jgi:hypothetical protein